MLLDVLAFAILAVAIVGTVAVVLMKASATDLIPFVGPVVLAWAIYRVIKRTTRPDD